MARNHSRTVLELFRVVLGLMWWMSLTLVPLQVVLSVVRAAADIDSAGWGNLGASATITDVPSVLGPATGEVEIADLPLGAAVAAGLLWLATVAVGLPVVWQLRRITRALLSRPFDHDTARRMRTLGPMVALVGLIWVVLDGVRSAIAVAAVSTPGVAMTISPEMALWALAAAGGFVLFAAALRAGSVLRQDHDLTI